MGEQFTLFSNGKNAQLNSQQDISTDYEAILGQYHIIIKFDPFGKVSKINVTNQITKIIILDMLVKSQVPIFSFMNTAFTIEEGIISFKYKDFDSDLYLFTNNISVINRADKYKYGDNFVEINYKRENNAYKSSLKFQFTLTKLHNNLHINFDAQENVTVSLILNRRRTITLYFTKQKDNSYVSSDNALLTSPMFIFTSSKDLITKIRNDFVKYVAFLQPTFLLADQ